MRNTENQIIRNFILAVVVALYLPCLFSYGMFFDGLTYSSLSRNLAIGDGSAFNLFYTETLYSNFFEHPPLFIWIQSIFFLVIGDFFWVEKFFDLTLLVFNLLLIYKLSIKIISNQYEIHIVKSLALFSVLLYLLIPINLFAYRSNLIELLVTTFTLLSIYFTLSIFDTVKNKFFLLSNYFLAVSFLWCAFATKGPVGLFPLITPILFIIFNKNSLKSSLPVLFIFYLFFFIIFALTYYLIQQSPDAKMYLETYFTNQIGKSLSGEREIAGNRFLILTSILLNLLIPIVIGIILKLSFNRKNENLFKLNKRTFYFVLCIGLSASIPLLISPKQREFYIVPSIPYFIIAIILFFNSEFIHIIKLIRKNIILKVTKALLIFSFGIPLYFFITGGNEFNLVKSIQNSNEDFNSKNTLCIEKKDFENWKMHAYFQRYARISLTDICESSNMDTLILKDNKHFLIK